MELKEFQIMNFRSIKDEKINFSHNCIVLVGKNEAGKTNILKALASIFAEYRVSTKDKRKRLDNEKIEQSYVRAIFRLDIIDFRKIIQKFNAKFKGSSVIKFKNGKSLLDYLKFHFSEFLIEQNIENTLPRFTYWDLKKTDFYLVNNLYLNGSTIVTDSISSIAFDLEEEIFQIITNIYDERPLKCHYWQYKDSYLLPSSVSIEDFIINPGNYKALENIFALSGRSDIKEEFDQAFLEDGDYSNLLEQISKKVTSTFQKIWKDFKGTSIQLIPNGSEILIKVVDKAKYNFEDRSDGFKKFISILLMISTQSRSNKYDHDLILIDEPDQSLYPTSASYLRDELFEISKVAKIIYSTHSQYMIDSMNLDRHYVVEKKDDITTIIKEDRNAPFSTDELLKRAVGSSIFECLQPVNIIFEGFLDKKLFDFYINIHQKEKEFSSYGMVFLGGISGAETLIQLLLLANKRFIIIADSDETSKNKRTEFEKNYPEFKENWIAYGDIDKSISTMEDFLKQKYLEVQIKKEGYESVYDEKKNAIINIENAVNKDKELKQKVKNSLMENLKKTDITENYTEFILGVTEKLNKM